MCHVFDDIRLGRLRDSCMMAIRNDVAAVALSCVVVRSGQDSTDDPRHE